MSKTKLHTKKERIVTALTITILKSSSFITLPQTFKRRSTTTKPRLVSYTINGISARAKVNQFIYKTKLLGLINDFKIDNAEDFIVAIGKCFPQQVEKESRNPETNYSSKYQLVDFPEFAIKILFRISNHNINCNNITDDVEEAYSIAIKSKSSEYTFKPNALTVTEYVFFTENCDRNRYKRIAENLLSFAETSVWDNNYVPADKINISPKESLDGIVSANATNNVWYYDSTKIKSWLSNGGQLQLLPSITTNSMFSEKDFSYTAKVEKESENQNKSHKNLQVDSDTWYRKDLGISLEGIKKADFMLEIKISKTSLSQISDLQTTTGLSSGTQRATRAFRTISATATSLRGIVANITDIGDTIKIFENKINNWDNEQMKEEEVLTTY